jgi:hypothetical protein
MYGAAPSAWVASAYDTQWKETLFQYISPPLLFQFKLQRLVAQANMAVIANGLELESDDQKRAFRIMIKVFDKQLKDMEMEYYKMDGMLTTPSNVKSELFSCLDYRFGPLSCRNDPIARHWPPPFSHLRRDRIGRSDAYL